MSRGSLKTSKRPPWLDRCLTSQLPIVIWSLLAAEPMHGYALNQEMQRLLGKACPAGTLYPLLNKWQEDGIIETIKDKNQGPGKPRLCYRLTAKGKRTLREQAVQWQSQQAKLQGLVLPVLRRIGRF